MCVRRHIRWDFSFRSNLLSNHTTYPRILQTHHKTPCRVVSFLARYVYLFH